MSAANKAKGRTWERDICTFLIERGWPHAERRRLAGAADKGDVAGIPGLVIEAKSRKSHDLAGAVDEAEVERNNAGAKYGVAWLKRRGKSSAGAGYVVMTGETFVELLREAGY